MGKLLFDLLPVILFFVAFKIKGIFIATGVAIAASIIQIGFLLIQKKKVDPIQWISLGIIVVFGGATLLAHNESFIKLKPTVLYFTFALILLVSQYILKKIPLKALLGTKLELTEKSWGGVNLSWGIFFVVLGIINLAVAHSVSTDIWVNFKLFGATGLTLAFGVGQAVVIGRHVKK